MLNRTNEEPVNRVFQRYRRVAVIAPSNSRGSVVDEAALVDALAKGSLGAAALDVFELEPDVGANIISSPNLILSPHQASATWETRAAMSQMVLAHLDEFFSR